MVRVTGLSHEGRGVARVDGKTLFLQGGLPREDVEFRYLRRRGRFDEGEVVRVITAAAERVEPACRHYAACGGCSLQHMSGEHQLRHKESVMLEQLHRTSALEPLEILPPMAGSEFGYRRKARLSVRSLTREGKAVVGFRERRGSRIADLQSCEVLHPRAAVLIPRLGELVGELSVRRHVPQIEVAVDEGSCGLVFRHLRPLSEGDLSLLGEFGHAHHARIFLQPGGEESVRPLDAADPGIFHYLLPGFDLDMEFGPVDFTQVNFEVNRRMVARVSDLLELASGDDVLDLFCGIGNFSLAIARRARSVTGIEGSRELVSRARSNAQRNGIVNAEFLVGDLHRSGLNPDWMKRAWHKVLLDPPRTGALELIRAIDLRSVSRLVYVSCNPATLARDAGVLVAEHGLVLSKAGVIDMFPQTAHVESVAVFDRRN